MATPGTSRPWTLLSNHGHVLVTVYLDPNARISEIAERVGITTRGAQMILHDLVEADFLVRRREGRRNIYSVPAGRLRHPAESHVDLAEFLAVFATPARRGRRTTALRSRAATALSAPPQSTTA
jgi:predicted transcriptional regulator